MDFSRTILEATQSLCFLDKERELDGIDLTPVLTGKTEGKNRILGWRRREWSLAGEGMNNVWAEAYINGEWKYIKEFREAPNFAKSIECEYPEVGYVELLYNLKKDTHEDHNLALVEIDKLREMRTEFEGWKNEVVEKDKHFEIPIPDQYMRNVSDTTTD